MKRYFTLLELTDARDLSEENIRFYLKRAVPGFIVEVKQLREIRRPLDEYRLTVEVPDEGQSYTSPQPEVLAASEGSVETRFDEGVVGVPAALYERMLDQLDDFGGLLEVVGSPKEEELHNLWTEAQQYLYASPSAVEVHDTKAEAEASAAEELEQLEDLTDEELAEAAKQVVEDVKTLLVASIQNDRVGASLRAEFEKQGIESILVQKSEPSEPKGFVVLNAEGQQVSSGSFIRGHHIRFAYLDMGLIPDAEEKQWLGNFLDSANVGQKIHIHVQMPTGVTICREIKRVK